ncbi:MAG: hypothetical protein AAGI07_02715 [Bacteroidota bacterium]
MKENDNIEKYFQKKLRNDAFSFEEAHWDQLEAKLDQVLPVAGAPRMITNSKLIFIIITAAIIAFFMGWFFSEVIFKNFSTSEQGTDKYEITLSNNEKIAKYLYQCEDLGFVFPEINPKTNSLTASSAQNAGVLQTTENTPFDSLKKTQLAISIKKPVDEKIPKKSNQNNEVGSLDTNGVIQPVIVEETNNQISISNTDSQTSITNTNNQTSISNTNNQISTAITNNSINNKAEEGFSNGVFKAVSPEDESLLMIAPYELQLIVDSSGIPLALVKKIASNDEYPSVINGVESINSKWGLSMLLAPDFSNTSTSDLFSSLSNAIGVRLDYQLLPRLRLGIGTTLSRKVYIAPNSDYSPPKGFWTDGVKPEEIDAKCLILEVPISVGYHLVNIKKTAIWINTAIASQFMLREDYDYIYATENPDLVQRWRGRNENNHLFSALSFSISFQRSLLRNWDGFVEPYFGSPLQGIGHGKVDLLGAGINIGLRYRFNKKAPSI